ncbi:MAG: dTDP-4-dehydrorhamnose 3,5-epimerase [Pirellulales bacterium]
MQTYSTDLGINAGPTNVPVPGTSVAGPGSLEPLSICATEFPGLTVIEPRVFEDLRGFFMETYHRERFAMSGLPTSFAQDNHSLSRRNVIRGLHYQIERPQGKLVRAIRGTVFDVAVDLRRSSPTFSRWFAVELSESNRKQVYIPPGFAHGFCALSDVAEVIYRCTEVYHPAGERTIVWNDPQLAIRWPVAEPILAEKDQRGLRLVDAPYYD